MTKKQKALVMVLMVGVAAALSAFAELGTSDIVLKYVIEGEFIPSYKISFQASLLSEDVNLEDGAKRECSVGSDTYRITIVSSGQTISVYDCSIFNRNEPTTVRITFSDPTPWSEESGQGQTLEGFSPWLEPVAPATDTDLRVTYSDPVDYRSSPNKLADFKIKWSETSDILKQGAYVSTLKVTIATV